MTLLLQRIRRSSGRRGVVEQRLDRVVQALGENGAGLRIELAPQTPHAGGSVDPRTQPRVATLPLERGNSVVRLGATDLLAQGPPELRRSGVRGNVGQERVPLRQA